jgi:hypothetical protein
LYYIAANQISCPTEYAEIGQRGMTTFGAPVYDMNLGPGIINPPSPAPYASTAIFENHISAMVSTISCL